LITLTNLNFGAKHFYSFHVKTVNYREIRDNLKEQNHGGYNQQEIHPVGGTDSYLEKLPAHMTPQKKMLTSNSYNVGKISDEVLVGSFGAGVEHSSELQRKSHMNSAITSTTTIDAISNEKLVYSKRK
jgi:hypothetical protein